MRLPRGTVIIVCGGGGCVAAGRERLRPAVDQPDHRPRQEGLLRDLRLSVVVGRRPRSRSTSTDPSGAPRGILSASLQMRPREAGPEAQRGREGAMSGRQIMTADEIRRATIRLSHEIVEKQAGTDGLLLIGIQRRGVPLARRIAAAILEHEGVDRAGRRARHHVLPRRPLAGRPAAGRQGHGAAVGHRRRGRSCSSTTCSTRAGRSGPRWTPSSTSGGRRRSASRCSWTAATASCRSAPTTSARTCRPRARSSSRSTSRRPTARTSSRSSGRRRRAPAVATEPVG